MLKLFKTTDTIIAQIDSFFDTIDKGAIIFKHGIANYINSDADNFYNNLQTIRKLEDEADELRRKIQNELYTRSLMPEYRGDVLTLIEKMDDIIDLAKENMNQLEVETPVVPVEVREDFINLAETSVEAAFALIISARAYFRDVRSVRDTLHRVYLFEKETDQIAHRMRRKIFKEIKELDMAHKAHLRYFILHIENISNLSESIADFLNIAAIKRRI